MKKKTQKIKILKNHYRIKNDNNKSKDNIYEEKDSDTYSYSYSYLSGNNLTKVNNASSSFLMKKEKEKEKEPKKANIILQKIKMENDDINKNKNFNITLNRNYSYLNYDDNDNSKDYENENEKNVSADANENKMILRQKKRKKILLKSNDENEDNKSSKKINSDKKVKTKKRKNKEKINKIKINFDFDKKSDKMKDIINKKINKIYKEEDNKKTKENSNDNDEVFFYNGCDNYIIKEKYKNNILTSNPKVNLNQNPINSCLSANTVSISFEKPKIEINNNFNSKSINVIQFYPNVNCKSTSNIMSKNKNTKSKQTIGKIYKKKQTNNSLSLSRNFNQSNNNDSNTNINNSSKSNLNLFNNSNFNCFNSAKVNTFKYENYNIPLLTEANKAYFKINTNSDITKTMANSKSNVEIVSKISKKYKIYQKPNKPKQDMACFQQTFKEINENRKSINIINPDSISFGSPRIGQEKNDNKEQKLNDDMNEKENGNIEVKKDISNNKKNSLISKDMKEEDNGLFSNSIDEPNQFGPRISIHKKQRNHHSFYYPIEKSNDEKFNNNAVSFKDNISPIESMESCRISADEKILNKKLQMNSENYSFDRIIDNYVHLPKSELLYITKEKKIITKINNKIKKIDKNENDLNKTLKNKIVHKKIKIKKAKDKNKINSISKDKTNNNNINNNYIPIKSNEENKDDKKNTFKEMVDKLNEKFGKSENLMTQKTENKKNVKESYSYDPIKKGSTTNKLNENNSALKEKDEIDNEKKKRYKIRSVVKIIKKNKSFGFLSQSKISKEEESEIKEEIKKEQTKQEQTKYDKINIIIKEDIENFISFYNRKNAEINGGKSDNNLKYDWSIIEQLIIKAKVDIIDIINAFLLICNEIIDNRNTLKIWNEYISQIIEHYKNNYLNEKNIKNIRIKILKILKQIDSINISNKYKFDIFGNLFYHFLIEGLFTEEDLNYFENEEQKIVIEIAKMIKFILILFCENNNNKACNEYHTKFKKTKLFNKNPIYFNYVTKFIKSSPNISS